MPMTSLKNMALSPAAVDLGLNPMQPNLNDETDEEKRKRMKGMTGEGGGTLGSPASMMLFGLGGYGV